MINSEQLTQKSLDNLLSVVEQLTKEQPKLDYDNYSRSLGVVCKFCGAESCDSGTDVLHYGNCVWLKAKHLIENLNLN